MGAVMSSALVLVVVGAWRRGLSVLLALALLLTACDDSPSTEATATTPAAAPSTASVVTTTEAVIDEEGQAGSCRVLEEKHCPSGELVLWDNDFGFLFVGFSLPPETPLFAFGGGEAREMFWSPDPTDRDPAGSYPGVNVWLLEPELGVENAVVLFMNRDGEPQVHLTPVEKGEPIGFLTSETLPVLPQGIQDSAYNLLVFLGDFDTASLGAYQQYFGLTIEP
jgi:hypothetical protein